MPSNHRSDITLILHCSQQVLDLPVLKLMEIMTSKDAQTVKYGNIKERYCAWVHMGAISCVFNIFNNVPRCHQMMDVMQRIRSTSRLVLFMWHPLFSRELSSKSIELTIEIQSDSVNSTTCRQMTWFLCIVMPLFSQP